MLLEGHRVAVRNSTVVLSKRLLQDPLPLPSKPKILFIFGS